ncbi:MAG: hypothetical protein JNJ93_03560 [Acinetobacter sp.]|nr:hypothetical protein [Acinetobacter sp.]
MIDAGQAIGWRFLSGLFFDARKAPRRLTRKIRALISSFKLYNWPGGWQALGPLSACMV